jgi:hypothetical protein
MGDMLPRGLASALSATLLLALPPAVPVPVRAAAAAPTPPHTYVFGRASFVTGNSPIALARGDLDGDGIPDVVAVDGQDDAISVLLGTAQGSFQPKVDYPTGTEPNAIALGDLDGNGTLDVVVVDQNCPSGTCGPGSVSVLLGNGDGTLQPAVSYATDTNPQSVAIGDFDEDGIPDLAVVNAITIITQGPGTVSILLGNGDGTFHAGAELPAGDGPGAIVAGDFDGDHHLDLAITNYIAINVANAVAVLQGDGHGSFASPASYPTANGPVQIVAADLDGDGDLDLATADLGGNAVSVLRNNGNGTFQAHADYPAGFGPKSIALADLDQDGKLDLALTTFTAASGGGSVVVLLGNGDATFQPFSEYLTGPVGPAILAGNVDADPKQDLLVTDLSHHLTVLLGNGDGTLVGADDYPTGRVPVAVTATDLNRDRKLDLVVADQLGTAVSLFIGNGDGTFQSGGLRVVGRIPTAVVAGHFDHDNAFDLAVANGSADTVSILLGHGDGTFEPKRTYATGSGPAALAMGDFNGDRELDLVVADQNADSVSVLLGVGDGTFLPRTDFAAGPGPISVTRADFDRDGNLDLAFADVNTSHFGPGRVSVLLGHGDGTFAAPIPLQAGVQAFAIRAGDFNGDGNPDLAVVTDLDVFGSVAILLGNGDGTFQPQVLYPTGRFSVALSVGDFNGDGAADLAVVNQANNTVTILAGRGDGTFELQANYGTGPGPGSLVLGDFNRDGQLDMAVANLIDSLSVFVSR